VIIAPRTIPDGEEVVRPWRCDRNANAQHRSNISTRRVPWRQRSAPSPRPPVVARRPPRRRRRPPGAAWSNPPTRRGRKASGTREVSSSCHRPHFFSF